MCAWREWAVWWIHIQKASVHKHKVLKPIMSHIQPLHCLNIPVCGSVRVLCVVLCHEAHQHSSRFYFSQWSYLSSKPLISYVLTYYLLTVCVWLWVCASPLCMCGHVSLVCARAWIYACACPLAYGCVFPVATELRVSATKACLCSSVSFTLRWWESAAPLIVFGVLGQHTQITLCACACVCKHVLNDRKLVVAPVHPARPNFM